MRYTLKTYQERAVRDMLDLIGHARARRANLAQVDESLLTQMTLAAATGAGKTVMMAAILERLLTECDTSPQDFDPTATVIWFSDDPALNEQSRVRVEAASDRLAARTVTLDTGTLPPVLAAGTVYFLNAQKLSSTSRLVRGGSGDDPDAPRPDETQTNFFDTLRATLDSPDRQVYLVLDEAHRGIRESSAKTRNTERDTIVRRLIAGTRGVPPIPTVLGISATPQRFDEAMRRFRERQSTEPVVVNPAAVQASGLLKDTVALSYPDEDGDFDTLLISRAAQMLDTATRRWDRYTQAQGLPPVSPLLVIQVPDKVTGGQVERYIDAVRSKLDIPPAAFAHVFGEHADFAAGVYTIRYTEPRKVAEDTSITVLLAKTAISTGWDCPRAEVLVSLRPAVDRTHITQLLGRMIRTPLARRIDGEPALGTVYCLLPRFDKATVVDIASALTRTARRARPTTPTAPATPPPVGTPEAAVAGAGVGGSGSMSTGSPARQGAPAPDPRVWTGTMNGKPVGSALAPADTGDAWDAEYVEDDSTWTPYEDEDFGGYDTAGLDDPEYGDGSGGGAGRTILLNSVDLEPNTHLPVDAEQVLAALERLDTATLPRSVRSPMIRLSQLCANLAADGLDTEPGAQALAHLAAALRGLIARFPIEYAQAREDVLHYRGTVETVDLNTGSGDHAEDILDVDQAALADALRSARKVFGPYAASLSAVLMRERLGLSPDDTEDEAEDADIEDASHAADADVAAAARVPQIVAGMIAAATEFADILVQRNSRTLAHHGVPDEQRARYESLLVAEGTVRWVPLAVPREDTAARMDRKGNPKPVLTGHVLADPDGNFPATLNTLEHAVLTAEMARPGFVAWYRNPGGASTGLAVDYTGDQGQVQRVRPDLLIVVRHGGGLAVDVVDPHGAHLSDALGKLRGLARYAERGPDGLRTVVAVSDGIDGKTMMLDLGLAAARRAVEQAATAAEAYRVAGTEVR